MDTRRDLVKLYHPSRQTPMEVVPANELVMDALRWNGSPVGNYSSAMEIYKHDLPSGIVVYGNNDSKRYRFKGGDSTNPESETFNGFISNNWVQLDNDCFDDTLPEYVCIETESATITTISEEISRIPILMDSTGTVDVSEALVEGLSGEGGCFYIPKGDYLISKLANLKMSNSVDVLAHPDATFYGGTKANPLDSSVLIVQVSPGAYAETGKPMDFVWKGGRFDLSNTMNSQVIPYTQYWPSSTLGQSNVTDAISLRGHLGDNGEVDGFGRVEVTGVTFYSGDHWQEAGGDTHLGVGGAESTHVHGNVFIGARDLGVYLSGSSNVAEGHDAFIYDNKFINCFGSAAVKRQYHQFQIHNNVFTNTPIAIFVSEDGVGGGGSISNNIFRYSGIGVRLDSSIGMAVDNNTSYEAGWLNSNGTTPNATYTHTGGSFINPVCVLADGVQGSCITNNRSIGKNPAYLTAGSCTSVLMVNSASNNVVALNSTTNGQRAVYEDSTCTGNQYVTNIDINNTSSSIYNGS